MNELCKLKGHMWYTSKRELIVDNNISISIEKCCARSIPIEKCCARCGMIRSVDNFDKDLNDITNFKMKKRETNISRKGGE